MLETIPVILFSHARPALLRQTLDCLKTEAVPLLYVFFEDVADSAAAPDLAEAKALVAAADWCPVVVKERPANMGPGASVLAGVSSVLRKHGAVLVFEDDLVCAPGAYAYLCAALRQYETDERVMSVTGWTHPAVTPKDVYDEPYFDGRADTRVWGTWARVWPGMRQHALSLMCESGARGVNIFRYGADLPDLAAKELHRRLWAVRFLYLHIRFNGLCLRPPWSMVEHLGDPDASGPEGGADPLHPSPALAACPPLPAEWPEPVEHADCSRLWQAVYGARPDNAEPLCPTPQTGD